VTALAIASVKRCISIVSELPAADARQVDRNAARLLLAPAVLLLRKDLLTVLVNNLTPGVIFGPNRSHTRYSLLMMRTRLVSEGFPRLLRSSRVTKPSARASLMAFLAVVRQTPALAAIASM